jgi:large subunit ribosomal protein L4
VVVDEWGFDEPRTKDAKAALEALNLSGKVLLVLGADEITAAKSFRNLPEVHPLLASELNAYDVLCSDWVVFTRTTLPGDNDVRDVEPSVVEAEAAVTEEQATEEASKEDAAAAADEQPGEAGEAGDDKGGDKDGDGDEGEADWDAPLRGRE